ncbi:MAG TPA: hypothetical protein VGA35_05510 [bacterium]
MPVRVDDGWSYAGLPVVRIENAALVADIVPSLGGKVLHLVDKRADRNVLWRHPRIPPHAGPLQANVDDHYSGGWDDAFPTGSPGQNRWGDQLPYLGEIWNLALTARLEEGSSARARLVLEGQTPITPARWTRTITVEGDAPALSIETRIENTGYLPFDFNWGSHPALAVHPGFRIDVPATTARVDDAAGGALGRSGDSFEYPILRTPGGEIDVRRVLPPETGAYALHILEGLAAGWVAATDVPHRYGFGVVFDHQVHRAVWQWMVYGGFRGWYHVILEPWLAGPPSLEDAVAAGEARVLGPGQVFEDRMWGVLYHGVEGVAGLHPDGSVIASTDPLR